MVERLEGQATRQELQATRQEVVGEIIPPHLYTGASLAAPIGPEDQYGVTCAPYKDQATCPPGTLTSSTPRLIPDLIMPVVIGG